MPAAERESGWQGAMRVRKQKRRGEGGEAGRRRAERGRGRQIGRVQTERERTENRQGTEINLNNNISTNALFLTQTQSVRLNLCSCASELTLPSAV